MQAIEFEAYVKDGTINVPIQLQKQNIRHFRFIALVDDSMLSLDERLSEALSFPGKVGGFPLSWQKEKMTREQMNER